MLKVTIEIGGFFKYLTGHTGPNRFVIEETLNQKTTLKDLILMIGTKYPDLGKVAFDHTAAEFTRFMLVTLNGYVVQSVAEMNDELKDGDAISLLPVFAGG